MEESRLAAGERGLRREQLGAPTRGSRRDPPTTRGGWRRRSPASSPARARDPPARRTEEGVGEDGTYDAVDHDDHAGGRRDAEAGGRFTLQRLQRAMLELCGSPSPAGDVSARTARGRTSRRGSSIRAVRKPKTTLHAGSRAKPCGALRVSLRSASHRRFHGKGGGPRWRPLQLYPQIRQAGHASAWTSR